MIHGFIKHLTVGAIATGLTACSASVPVKMYPTKGPLSKLAPPPVIVATAEGVTSNSGALSLTLPSGASCEGTWSSVAPRMAGSSWGTLFSQYGTAAGVSGSVAIVPGVNQGQFYAVCKDNTRIEGEFVTGSGTANGHGVAKDSNGNIYKILF